MYYGARYYHPVIGRFTQPDPVVMNIGSKEFAMAVANPQLLNPYAYVGNNPIKFVDDYGATPRIFTDMQQGVGFWVGGQGMFYTAQGAYTIESFLNSAAQNGYEQGGSLRTGAAFLTEGAASAFGNAGKVADPTIESGGKRGFAVVMLSVDLAGGGEGKAGSKVGKQVVKESVERAGRVTKYVKDLDVGSRTVKTLDDIAGFTKEGINQITSRGIKPEFIKDTVVNTRRYMQRVDEFGRESFRYIGDKAVLNFNRAKELITGWVKK